MHSAQACKGLPRPARKRGTHMCARTSPDVNAARSPAIAVVQAITTYNLVQEPILYPTVDEALRKCVYIPEVNRFLGIMKSKKARLIDPQYWTVDHEIVLGMPMVASTRDIVALVHGNGDTTFQFVPPSQSLCIGLVHDGQIC